MRRCKWFGHKTQILETYKDPKDGEWYADCECKRCGEFLPRIAWSTFWSETDEIR